MQAPSRSTRPAGLGVVLVLVLLVAGCGDDEAPADVPAAADADLDAARERTTAIGEAVQAWARADSVDAAHAAAEEARNLVTGPGVLGAGDLDGDGRVAGPATAGLLPGVDPGQAGLASPLEACEEVERDVLGGSWDDPDERWATLAEAIDGWSPSTNTFPALPSHPQRVVGWASLTLATDDLDEAHEYAGHARLHVEVAERALDRCA